LLVFLTRLLQREVVLPDVPHPSEPRCRRPLDFGEDTKGQRFENGNAAPRAHLCGDQQDMPDHYGHEKPSTALADVEKSHCHLRLTWAMDDGGVRQPSGFSRSRSSSTS